jgi:hypothetical protein
VSALSDLAGAAGGAVTGGLWKVGAIVLAVLLMASSAGLGFEWWLAARDRDAAKTEATFERGRADDFQAAVREQNRALEALGKLTAAAEARGQAAQQLAAANGKRFDAALAAAVGKRATTCAEAMPVVNQLLKDVK